MDMAADEPPAPRGKWFKQWVPQELAAKGGKCSLLKWVTEDTLKALTEKCNEAKAEETKPEPTTEVLFLCSYEGCGKTFADPLGIKKHAHIHGERQHVCHFEGCGKKFLDSSKLKRHFLIHTGEKDYICPHEGCGKAFSLDFNLRAHMRTHSLENYHVCPYPECGKRYTVECKLKSHIKAHHEKNTASEAPKQTPVPEKTRNPPKPPAAVIRSADRPYACPYEGCGKAYIHEYKLNLHLRREHPGHNGENEKQQQQQQQAVSAAAGPANDEYSDQDVRITGGGPSKNPKRSKPNLTAQKAPLPSPLKVPQWKSSTFRPATNSNAAKKQWPMRETDEDSEETEEEDREIADEDRWRYRVGNEDDEETEDED